MLWWCPNIVITSFSITIRIRKLNLNAQINAICIANMNWSSLICFFLSFLLFFYQFSSKILKSQKFKYINEIKLKRALSAQFNYSIPLFIFLLCYRLINTLWETRWGKLVTTRKNMEPVCVEWYRSNLGENVFYNHFLSISYGQRCGPWLGARLLSSFCNLFLF